MTSQDALLTSSEYVLLAIVLEQIFPKSFYTWRVQQPQNICDFTELLNKELILTWQAQEAAQPLELESLKVFLEKINTRCPHHPYSDLLSL